MQFRRVLFFFLLSKSVDWIRLNFFNVVESRFYAFLTRTRQMKKTTENLIFHISQNSNIIFEDRNLPTICMSPDTSIVLKCGASAETVKMAKVYFSAWEIENTKKQSECFECVKNFKFYDRISPSPLHRKFWISNLTLLFLFAARTSPHRLNAHTTTHRQNQIFQKFIRLLSVTMESRACACPSPPSDSCLVLLSSRTHIWFLRCCVTKGWKSFGEFELAYISANIGVGKVFNINWSATLFLYSESRKTRQEPPRAMIMLERFS